MKIGAKMTGLNLRIFLPDIYPIFRIPPELVARSDMECIDELLHIRKRPIHTER